MATPVSGPDDRRETPRCCPGGICRGRPRRGAGPNRRPAWAAAAVIGPTGPPWPGRPSRAAPSRPD